MTFFLIYGTAFKQGDQSFYSFLY